MDTDSIPRAFSPGEVGRRSDRGDSRSASRVAWSQLQVRSDHRWITASAFRATEEERILYTCVTGCDSCPLRCFVMTTILDDQLYAHSDRLAGKVVLITGECLHVCYVSFWWPEFIIPQFSRRGSGHRKRNSAPVCQVQVCRLPKAK